MPTKTYKCTNKKCNYIVDKFLGCNEEFTDACPECGSKVIRDYKSIGVNLRFKDSYNSTR